MPLLTCLQCKNKWSSTVDKPVACPKKGCRSRIWSRERSKTRIINEEEKNRLRSMSGNTKGRKQTPEHIAKRIFFGDKHPSWKGEDVGYAALHQWIRKNLLKPEKCLFCGEKKLLEVTNISGNYLRALLDWKWQCRKCHMVEDGRLEKLHNNRIGAKQIAPEERLK